MVLNSMYYSTGIKNIKFIRQMKSLLSHKHYSSLF